jgi:large subunit ribosomal protein L10e
MAKLRKGVAYRRLERPYTRKSKYRAKNYVRANPHNLIVRYDMGDQTKAYSHKLELLSDQDIQLRHNSIESARKTANKLLETKLARNYMFKIKMFPHHVLRENPLASGAGADRMSTGMTMSFGKPIGVAAQTKKGKAIMEIKCDEKDVPTAKEALKRAQNKFPMHCIIRIGKNIPKVAKVRNPNTPIVVKVGKAPPRKYKVEKAPK